MVTRNQGIKTKKDESAAKLLSAYIRKAEEGTVGKLIVETVILLSARTPTEGSKTLQAAAQVYGVDLGQLRDRRNYPQAATRPDTEG